MNRNIVSAKFSIIEVSGIEVPPAVAQQHTTTVTVQHMMDVHSLDVIKHIMTTPTAAQRCGLGLNRQDTIKMKKKNRRQNISR